MRRHGEIISRAIDAWLGTRWKGTYVRGVTDLHAARPGDCFVVCHGWADYRDSSAVVELRRELDYLRGSGRYRWYFYSPDSGDSKAVV